MIEIVSKPWTLVESWYMNPFGVTEKELALGHQVIKLAHLSTRQQLPVVYCLLTAE